LSTGCRAARCGRPLCHAADGARFHAAAAGRDLRGGLDVVLPDALEYAAALDAADVPQRLIVAHGLPHTFLRALHFCGSAERAFTDFGRAMAELLQD
jgi:acetyl esterase/lipase